MLAFTLRSSNSSISVLACNMNGRLQQEKGGRLIITEACGQAMQALNHTPQTQP